MYLRTAQGHPYMVLIKQGERRRLEALRNGCLYMNALSYFRECEEDTARGDSYEGTSSLYQPKHIGEFTFSPGVPGWSPIKVKTEELAGPVRISADKTKACNLFCLISVREPILHPIFPDRYKWFGDSFVLITNTQEFLARVYAAAKREMFPVEAKCVEYYSASEHSGPTGRFRKRDIYSYQREFRIALETGRDGPYLLLIGDIKDITSEVFPISAADAVLDFSPAAAQDAGLILEQIPKT